MTMTMTMMNMIRMNVYLRLHLLIVLSGLAAAAHDHSQTTSGSNQDNDNGNDSGGSPDISAELPYLFLLSMGSLVAIIAICHLASRVAAHIRKLACLNNETQRSFVQASPTLALVKEHLVYAPLLRTRHSDEFKLGSRSINMGTVPSRLPALLICGLFAMNLVLLLIDISFSDPEQDVAGMLVGRAGTLTVINLFPLILIAGRNNILIKLLGVSFDTFNLFHRWLARIVVLLAITHALSYIIPTVQKGKFPLCHRIRLAV